MKRNGRTVTCGFKRMLKRIQRELEKNHATAVDRFLGRKLADSVAHGFAEVKTDEIVATLVKDIRSKMR